MQDVAHIEAVAVVGPTTLAVTWGNGTVSEVDLAGWIARGSEPFAPLKDPAVFARAEVGLYGGDVTWGGDDGILAIDSEHLHMLADHQAPFAAVEVAAWQADMGVSNAEAADLVGVVPSTWSSYKAGANVPATVARLCRAMRADPVILSAHLKPRTAGNPGGSPIFADPEMPARLRWRENNRAVTGHDGPLRDVVRAFHALPEEKQGAASIVLASGRGLYKAAAIRRLCLTAAPDGEATIRATLEAPNRLQSFNLG